MTASADYRDFYIPRAPTPRPAGVMSMQEWVLVHDRDLTRMMRFMQVRLSVPTGTDSWCVWDWNGVRRSLEVYVYKRSANRFKDYRFIK